MCVQAKKSDRASYVTQIRLCIFVRFHIQRFEPHICIIEGFGALEMPLLSLL